MISCEFITAVLVDIVGGTTIQLKNYIAYTIYSYLQDYRSGSLDMKYA